MIILILQMKKLRLRLDFLIQCPKKELFYGATVYTVTCMCVLIRPLG